MKHLLFILPAFFVLLISCRWDGGPGQLDEEVYKNLSRTHSIHPRLLVTEKEQKRLLPELATVRKWLWERYLEDLPGKRAEAANLPEELGRNHGDLASDLAFAWLMTGRDSLFQEAKTYLLNLSSKEVWDPEYGLLHGHLLMGVALSYDWLYPRLSRDERAMVSERLGQEAEIHYQNIVAKRAWYRNQYLQNHAYVSFAGLAFAAVALYGEDARAQDWLGICEKFFQKAFQASSQDGGSIEGLSYGNYAMEFALRYAELARTVLGRNYYNCPWLVNYPDYLIHSLLPSPLESEWAMTFGDSPRHGNYHGPEPQLFLLAAQEKNSRAQWLGKKLIGIKAHGLNSATWWSILWYDPSVEEADPSGFPTARHFTDLDQVMMRSSWTDSAATLVGFKCGPFMGKSQSKEPAYDLGCAHGHPDAGSFQIYAHGQMVAVDPGYTSLKKTGNHNTLLVKGRGQLGEQEPWFAAGEAIRFRQFPEIIESRSTPDYDYVIGDVTRAYHPALGLVKFLRHLVFIKPDLILIADELTLDDRGILYSYPADTLELEGLLKHNEGYVTGTKGRAGFTFQGLPGTYTVGVSYLDNAPNTGSYALLVESDTLRLWQDTVTVTDTHLETIPRVKLLPGSRVTLVADPFGNRASLVKIIVYNPDIRADRDIAWLLHFEPNAVLERKFTCIQATVDNLALDVYPIAPQRRNHDWGIYEVTKGQNLKTTMKLVIKPVFADTSTTLLALFHVRTRNSPPIEWMRADIFGSTVHINLYKDRKPFILDFDPPKRKINIQKQVR